MGGGPTSIGYQRQRRGDNFQYPMQRSLTMRYSGTLTSPRPSLCLGYWPAAQARLPIVSPIVFRRGIMMFLGPLSGNAPYNLKATPIRPIAMSHGRSTLGENHLKCYQSNSTTCAHIIDPRLLFAIEK